MPIAILPPELAATIAAGEVVERPASVVKELVENAIDAGARRIRIEIERGGLHLIRVTDDGAGVAPQELALAFQRHATSKLRRPQDLETLGTLGFRGEALPSIAAAAEVEFASRRSSLAAGARLRLRQGAIVEQTVYAGGAGTVVSVHNLFEQQPARRKFLRSTAAEAGVIATLAGRLAIAYPEIAFTLTTDGRRSLATTGAGERREAVARVYGAETAAALLDLSLERAAAGEPAVVGLLSPPSLTRATRAHMIFFVNRRLIQPRRLTYAVEEGYESQLLSSRHPLAIVDIVLPPSDVDVNVHPAKSEVRFRDERMVFSAVNRAVRRTLSRLAPTPPARILAATSEEAAHGAEDGQALPLWQAAPLLDEQAHSSQPPASQRNAQRPTLPILRVVGQTGSVYIVAEGPDGMYLVDQHAAHERVLYEQIVRERGARAVERQGLLTPASVELTPAQSTALSRNDEPLREHGFELEPFGARSYLLRAVPAVLRGKDPSRALAELLDDLLEPGDAGDRESRLAMTLACHAAVRAGKTMALEEMRELLRLLEGCELPRTCPHGRPTMVHLSAAALEREFRRR